jgi:hypothetical protein
MVTWTGAQCGCSAGGSEQTDEGAGRRYFTSSQHSRCAKCSTPKSICLVHVVVHVVHVVRARSCCGVARHCGPRSMLATAAEPWRTACLAAARLNTATAVQCSHTSHTSHAVPRLAGMPLCEASQSLHSTAGRQAGKCSDQLHHPTAHTPFPCQQRNHTTCTHAAASHMDTCAHVHMLL